MSLSWKKPRLSWNWKLTWRRRRERITWGHINGRKERISYNDEENLIISQRQNFTCRWKIRWKIEVITTSKKRRNYHRSYCKRNKNSLQRKEIRCYFNLWKEKERQRLICWKRYQTHLKNLSWLLPRCSAYS